MTAIRRIIVLGAVLFSAVSGKLAAQLIVTNYVVVSQQVLSTSYVKLTFRASAANSSNSAFTNVSASAVSSSSSTVILTGVLNFGNVPANATVGSSNTFSVRQLRSVAFNPSTLTWTFSTTSSNPAPIAKAGPNQQVTIGATVHLDGSGSSDPAGRTLNYQWTLLVQPSGSNAALSSRIVVNPSFIADLAGTYKIELIVSDGVLSSAPSVVIIGASTPPPPVAVAGPNQAVAEGVTVHLDGSGSSDPGGRPLTYVWSFVSKPAGSAAVLSDPASVVPTFVADTTGNFILQLVVNNGTSNSSPSDITVAVNAPVAPVANAGPNQTVAIGANVQLDGSHSTDPNSLPLTYRWSFTSIPAGSTAVLSSNSAVMPTFVADVAGGYIVQLIVNNGYLDSLAAIMTVSTSVVAPVANAGPSQTVNIGSTVQLDGSGSTDANGLPLTYSWSFTTVPAGSAATLSSTTAVRPTFIADLYGTYVANLVVNNGFMSSAPSTVTITTNDVPPTARISAPAIAATRTTVQLDGSGSSDVNGHSLIYAWSVLSKPVGSSAVLSNAADVQPTFIADLDGLYVVQLIVNDGTFNSPAVTGSISTTSAHPIANAGANQLANVGGVVTLDSSHSSDPNGLALTYAWSILSKPAGSNATLSNSGAVSPTFTVDIAGNYAAQLIVSDSLFSSAPVTVLISTVNIPPTANPGSPQTVSIIGTGTLVTLDGSGSTSARGFPLTYTWSMTTKPAGSTALLSGANTANPTFTADLAGPFVAQLIVNDGIQPSAPATVTVTAIYSKTITVTIAPSTILTSSTATGNVHINLAAPSGGQQIFLSSDNATLASVPTSVSIPAGQQDVAFPVNSNFISGSATITGSAPNFNNGTASVSVNLRTLSLNLNITLIGAGRHIGGTVTMVDPVPPSGVTVNLASSASNIATIAPSSIVFAVGQGSAAVTVTGVSAGSASLSATANGYAQFVVNVTVTNRLIVLAQGVTVGPGQNAPLPVSLSQAPAAPVNITLQSLNTSIATVSPATVTVPAGQTTPSTQPRVTGVALGTATIRATSTTYATDQQSVSVTLNLMFSPTSQTVLTDNTATLQLNLSSPAPAGGLTVTLSMDDPTKATVSETVNFPAGSASQAVTITGVGPGFTTMRATLAGTTGSSAAITINPAPGMTLNPVTVGYNLETFTNGTLALPAPAGNLSVVISSSDPSVLLSPDAVTPGSSQVTVQVGAGLTVTPNVYVQGLATTGTIVLTARATGYAHTTASVTLNPSGFVFTGFPSNSFSTSTLSADTTINVQSAVLQPGTLIVGSIQAVRPGASQNVAIGSSNTSAGTIVGSPVLFLAGTSSASATFHPVGGGTSTVAITQPTGFSTPASGAQLAATVTAPGITLGGTNVLGRNLQAAFMGTLGANAPAGNETVTLTSSDATKLLLSPDNVTSGSASIILQVGAGSTQFPTFYAQAIGGSGTTVQITATAPKFSNATFAIALRPSGFVVYNGQCSGPPAGNGCGTLNTTSLAPNSPIGVQLAVLNTAGSFLTSGQTLRPGIGPVSVNVSSSTTTVGTIINSPLTFSTGDSAQSTSFHPLSGGSTTIRVGTPTGFSLPTNYQTVSVIVSGNPISPFDVTVGHNLQTPLPLALGTPAPAGNVQLTVSSNNPSVKLSTDPTLVGTASKTVTVFAGQSLPASVIYAQAFAGSGSVTLTASASGYTTQTATATLAPSGPVVYASAYCYPPFGQPCSINTTFSQDIQLAVTLSVLDSSLNFSSLGQTLRPGMGPVALNVSSSVVAVGTIAISPLTFNPGDSTQYTSFHAMAAGTTNVGISTPSAFSTPANYQSIPITVTAPGISLSNINVGNNLQQFVPVSLAVAPPSSGVSVTVSSGDPSRLLLSTDPTLAGGSSVTVPVDPGNVTSSTAIYAQSLAGTGTVMLTASAPGFAAANATATLTPAGVIVYPPSCYLPFGQPCSLSATTLQPDTPVTVTLVNLDPTTLNFVYDGYAPSLRPGVGPINVAVTSTNPEFGTITTSPITFHSGDSSQTTYFHAVAAGITTIDINTPSGFVTPSNYQTIPTTVSAPAIYVSNVSLGKNLQQFLNVSLATPALLGGEAITISSGDTSKLLLSTDPAVLGGASVTVLVPENNVSSPTPIYAQGLVGVGTVTMTASAAGFAPSTGTATMVPSGAIVYLQGCYLPNGLPCTLNTTDISADSTVTVALVNLDPTTRNYLYDGTTPSLRPGLGPVSVNVTSSNPGVGAITSSPVTFNANDSIQSTAFHPMSVGTTTVGINVPIGFSVPSNFQTISTSVTLPGLQLNSMTVGRKLEVPQTASLQVLSSNPTTITISVADSTKALLSTDPTVLGSNSLSFVVPPGTYSTPTFYVQAVAPAVGSVQYSASALGFATVTSTITINPSGFVLSNFQNVTAFSTTVGAADTTLNVAPAMLDPGTLNLIEIETLLPGSTNTMVPVTSSNTSSGTITVSPVIFQGADNPDFITTSFHPMASGTSTVITVGAPTGFRQASSPNQITANVN